MRIGEMVGGHTSRLRVGDYIEIGKDLEARGFDTMWIPHVFGHDGITLSALVGHETERIELATAVVPTYPRHPVAIAQQSVTAAAASRGRAVAETNRGEGRAVEPRSAEERDPRRALWR